eukprot:m51a1_g2308 hypothetical protein (748) ;mRNA; r:456122-462671
MRTLVLCLGLAALASALCQRFGGWAFIDHGGAGGGTPEPWMTTSTNLMFFAFIDPSTMAVPDSFRSEVARYDRAETLVMFSIGGQDYGDKWTWLSSEASARQMAARVATWRSTYGCHGIDIDAEEGSVMNGDWHIMGAFLEELKRRDPGILISLDVYGSPGGRDYHNNLINQYLLSSGSHPNTIDWINIMAYSNYDSTKTYVEYYTKAVYSQWWPTLNGPVDPSKVVVGIAGTGFYSNNCNPSDYTAITNYVKQNGLLGESVWAFIYTGSSMASSWWTPNCYSGYVSIYNALSGSCSGPQPTKCSSNLFSSCPSTCQRCSTTQRCIETTDTCPAASCSTYSLDQCPSTCQRCSTTSSCIEQSATCPAAACSSFSFDQCPSSCKKCATNSRCLEQSDSCPSSPGGCSSHPYLQCPSGCQMCAWTQTCKEPTEFCSACTPLTGTSCGGPCKPCSSGNCILLQETSHAAAEAELVRIRGEMREANAAASASWDARETALRNELRRVGLERDDALRALADERSARSGLEARVAALEAEARTRALDMQRCEALRERANAEAERQRKRSEVVIAEYHAAKAATEAAEARAVQRTQEALKLEQALAESQQREQKERELGRTARAERDEQAAVASRAMERRAMLAEEHRRLSTLRAQLERLTEHMKTAPPASATLEGHARSASSASGAAAERSAVDAVLARAKGGSGLVLGHSAKCPRVTISPPVCAENDSDDAATFASSAAAQYRGTAPRCTCQ